MQASATTAAQASTSSGTAAGDCAAGNSSAAGAFSSSLAASPGIPAIAEGKHAFLIVSLKDKVPSNIKSTVSITQDDIEFSFKDGKLVHLGKKDGQFEITDIAPGKYTATYLAIQRGGKRTNYKPMELDVPEEGLTGLVLRPQQAEGSEGSS